MARTVSLLNEYLKVVSYDGVQDEDEECGVENVLLTPPCEEIHCSAPGRNFNLLLQAKEDLTVTHLVVYKGSRS